MTGLSELARAILAGVSSNKLPTETGKDGLPVGAVKDGETARVVEKPVIDTVVAIRRVDPSKEDIRGYFECKEEGCLEFGFDNSFSYFRTKIVELNLSVMDM